MKMMRKARWLGGGLVVAVGIAMMEGGAWARTQICGTDIDNYLRDNGSPMVGEGARYVKWGKYFNVDPRLMVGISNAESTLGKSPCGTNDTGTWNAWGWFGGLGHCWPYFEPGLDTDTNRDEFKDAPGFVTGQGITMATGWEDGIFWVTRTIRKEYLDQGYNTVAKIRPKYCTSGCTNWETNANASINAMGGDTTQLDFPGESCTSPPSTPPSVNFNEDNKNKWSNDANAQIVKWSLQDRGGGIGGFSQNWDSDPGGSAPQFPNSTGGDLKFSYIAAAQREGQHTAHVRAWNAARNNSEDFPSGWYGYDATAPVVTITSGQTNGSTYNTPQRIEWSLNDGTNRSGLKNWTQAWDNSPAGGPFTSTAGWLDLPEGTHTLHVHAWDNAGNDKDWTWTFTYQKVGTLSVSTNSNAGCAVSGEVFVNGQSWGVAPQSRTVNVGTYTVSFGAVAGWTTPDNLTAIVNDGQPTPKTGIYRDETKPDLIVTQSPAANTCLSAAGQICWSVSDVCGAPTVAYSWDNAAYTNATGSCVQTLEGTHSLRLKATDNVGNVREITVGTFAVDSTAPAAPTNLAFSPAHYTATLTWTAPVETGCAAVAGYNVYRRRTEGGVYLRVNTSLVTSTTYTDRAANGVLYDYAVAAVDDKGREGAKVEITGKVVGKPGDMNGDGSIDITDVIAVTNVINNLATATPAQKALADYNGSGGDPNAADVTAMKNSILGK